jgi:hypothetical protein
MAPNYWKKDFCLRSRISSAIQKENTMKIIQTGHIDYNKKIYRTEHVQIEAPQVDQVGKVDQVDREQPSAHPPQNRIRKNKTINRAEKGAIGTADNIGQTVKNQKLRECQKIKGRGYDEAEQSDRVLRGKNVE